MEMSQADKSLMNPALEISRRRVATRELELEIDARYPRARSSSSPRRAYPGSNAFPSPLTHPLSWGSCLATPMRAALPINVAFAALKDNDPELMLDAGLDL